MNPQTLILSSVRLSYTLLPTVHTQPGNFCLNLDASKKPIIFCIDLGECVCVSQLVHHLCASQLLPAVNVSNDKAVSRSHTYI